MTDTAAVRPRIVLDCIYYAVAISFFLYIFYYYWTGVGGATLLALTLIPITFVLFTLQALRDDDLYPRCRRSRTTSSPRSIRLLAGRLLLHEHRIRGARHLACRHVGPRRPDHRAA